MDLVTQHIDYCLKYGVQKYTCTDMVYVKNIFLIDKALILKSHTHTHTHTDKTVSQSASQSDRQTHIYISGYELK